MGMGKPYSMDLRQRVVAAIEGWLSTRQAAARFAIGIATAGTAFGRRLPRGPDDLAGCGTIELSGSRGGLLFPETEKRHHPEQPLRADKGACAIAATGIPLIRPRSPGG